MSSPVLVIGGTRGTGLLIARLLLDAGRAVRVLARDPVRARKVLPAAAEVIPGDITVESTLAPALAGVAHVIFTAGCRSGRPVLEREVRRVEHDGVVNTLAAAARVGFAGRFLYMTASSVGARSFMAWALNVYKGNTLVWRGRAESAIRASPLPYTIIRAGMLTNDKPGTRAVEVTQQMLPLSLRYRIARADVAAAFLVALEHPRTVRTTFDLVWSLTGAAAPLANQFAALRPD